MIIVLLVWIIAFLICLGVGLAGVNLLTRLSGKVFARTVLTLSDTLCVGLILIYTSTLVCSVAFPVNVQLGIFLAIFCLLGFVFGGLSLRIMVSKFRKEGYLKCGTFLGITSVLLLSIAYFASGPITGYDNYLYHLGAVRWNSEFGTVRGLVNLHSRFGFNSSFHTFAALFDMGIFKGMASHLALSFLSVFTLLRCLHFCVFRNALRPIGFVALALMFATLKISFVEDIASLSTDSAMGYFCVLTVLELLWHPSFRISLRRNDSDNFIKSYARKAGIRGFLFASFSVLTFTTKMSGAAFLLGSATYLGFILLMYWRSYPLSVYQHRQFWFSFVTNCSIPVILITTHITRNILLSGWILYPITFFDLHLPWGRRINMVEFERNIIQAWGRVGSSVFNLKFSDWFAPWFQNRISLHNKILLFGGLIFTLLNLALFIRDRLRKKDMKLRFNETWFYSTIFICFISWFLNAPDQRFIVLVFPIFFFVACVQFIFRLVNRHSIREAFFVLIIWATFSDGMTHGLVPSDLFSRPLEWFHLSPPEALRLKSYPVHIGPNTIADFYIPRDDDRCGYAPLLCSPFIADNFRLFNPHDIGAGFYLDTCNSEDQALCTHVERVR